MHLASKSFSESGQESGRLVAEQNKRAFSLDRHEWEDFAVCSLAVACVAACG